MRLPSDDLVTRIVFVGPTLPLHTIPELPSDTTILPPIERGDLERAEQIFPNLKSIGIVDGKLFQAFAISPKEILRQMDRGKRIFGSSGIGALRATELAMFGMTGVGKIYSLFAAGELDADDEVLRTYDPDSLEPISEPMVDIRFALEHARDEGVLSADTVQAAVEEARGLYYPDRRFDKLLARLEGQLPAHELTCLKTVFESPRKATREDALRLLTEMGILDACGSTLPGPESEIHALQHSVQKRTANRSYWPALPAENGAPPLRKTVPAANCIELPSPAPHLPEPLDEVLRRRRSIRTYGSRAVGLEELSTLLFHAARAIPIPDGSANPTIARRPFPSAGARSELELYVVSENIAGLQSATYYYDPFEHRFAKLRSRDSQHRQVLSSVLQMAGGVSVVAPSAVILITAVFDRILWKYGDLGPSLIYKNVGALLQTFYLVSTALGLAPCAMGGGEEVQNSRWLGLDPKIECQVGCLSIGPAPQ